MISFLRIRKVAKAVIALRYFVKRVEAGFCYSSLAEYQVFDVPDPRDYVASEILDVNIIRNLKDYQNLFTETNQNPENQYDEPACTAFGTSKQKSIEDSFEHSELIEHNPWKQWENQGEPEGGDLLNRSLKVMRNYPPVTDGKKYPMIGYSIVRHRGEYGDDIVHQLKSWIARKNPIKTGIDIRKHNDERGMATNMYWAGKTGVLNIDPEKGRKIGGHDITIVGYDDTGEYFGVKGFIAWTSWGEWGKKNNGLFIIPYDQVEWLYTCYVIHDAIDVNEDALDKFSASPTRKAYLSLKRIWRGAKWEDFKRWWLGKRRTA